VLLGTDADLCWPAERYFRDGPRGAAVLRTATPVPSIQLDEPRLAGRRAGLYPRPLPRTRLNEVVQAGYAEQLERTLFGVPGTQRGYTTADTDPAADPSETRKRLG
jgi:hypothetical protein